MACTLKNIEIKTFQVKTMLDKQILKKIFGISNKKEYSLRKNDINKATWFDKMTPVTITTPTPEPQSICDVNNYSTKIKSIVDMTIKFQFLILKNKKG